MQKSHLKPIKGMAIACIVLAGLAIFSALISAMIAFAASGELAQRVSVYSSSRYITTGREYASAASVFGAFGGYGIFSAIACGVSLAGAIIILRSVNDPSKYATIRTWAIVGAICSGVSLSVAACVLFILIAVFANNDKRLYDQGCRVDAYGFFVGGYQGAPYQAPGYAAPGYAAPGYGGPGYGGPGYAPQPQPGPMPQPVAGPGPQPQPAPQSVAGPGQQPQPQPQPAAQPASEPQPVAQPQPQPAAEPAPQPVAEPAAPTGEPVAPAAEPATPAAEPTEPPANTPAS